jgi:hypothetical protein
MITMFNTMPLPVSRREHSRPTIIAALLLSLTLVLGACGMVVKLSYNQGSPIAFRWLDGFVDFDDAQSLRVRAALDEWFAWNRRTQLPDYADRLARAEVELLADTTPRRVCGWTEEIRGRFDAGLEHARPALAEVIVTMTPQQIGNVEKKNAERNATWRDDFLQRDPAKRRQAAVRRDIELAERLYGTLDATQREMVGRWVANSPFDADLVYAERLRRQQDALALLRRLIARPARADAETEIQAYLERLDRSPRVEYRHHAEKLVEYNCAFAAALHNATSSEQRRAAAAKLRDYEMDLRALAAEAAS